MKRANQKLKLVDSPDFVKRKRNLAYTSPEGYKPPLSILSTMLVRATLQCSQRVSGLD
jgi:hypothetical protein